MKCARRVNTLKQSPPLICGLTTLKLLLYCCPLQNLSDLTNWDPATGAPARLTGEKVSSNWLSPGEQAARALPWVQVMVCCRLEFQVAEAQ